MALNKAASYQPIFSANVFFNRASWLEILPTVILTRLESKRSDPLLAAPRRDRFRKDLGGLVEAYTEVARRLGIMKEDEPVRTTSGPKLVQ